MALLEASAWPRSERLSRRVGPTLLAGAVAALLLLGVVGLGRTSPRFQDFDFFYTGGALWLAGTSPYEPSAFASAFAAISKISDFDRVFPYPPTIAPLCMALALLPHDVARFAVLGVNALAVALLAWLSVLLVARAEQPAPARDSRLEPWILASLVVANPFTMRTVWVAQITLVVAVCVVSAWYLARRQRELAAGIALGLATIKPQFMILPALWLLLDRRFKTLGVAALVGALLGAYPLALQGPLPLLREWLHSMSLFQLQAIDHLGSPVVIGLPSALAGAGLPHPSAMAALAVAMAIVAGLWTQRRRLCPDDHLAVILGVQVGLVWAHESDLMLLAPVLAASWLHLLRRSRSPLWTAPALLLLFLPSRLVRLAGLPLLEHWKTAVVIFALFALLAQSTRRALAERRPATDAPSRAELVEPPGAAAAR